MSHLIELPFIASLRRNLAEQRPFIQVILGPRQVGKTTGVQQVLSKYDASEYFYCSADGDVARASAWLRERWELAKAHNPHGILVVDEIQKVENWSESLKALWDRQAQQQEKMQVVVLGSSSLALQQGLTESLAGRFQKHSVYHWSAEESLAAYGLTLEEFLRFGGYPGSYLLREQPQEWVHYVKESIIAPVIGKDILSQARVKSPALFRQCFDLVCSYPAQEISYTKLLGQLQDKGNTDLVKYYLELFEGAFLLKQLFKYSAKPVLRKRSSPKILPLCPALYSVGLGVDMNAEERGRAFEVTIGALLNRLPGDLYYWRERNAAVDFVYVDGKCVHAIEVKSGQKVAAKGLAVFTSQFPHAQTHLVTPENYQRVLAQLQSRVL